MTTDSKLPAILEFPGTKQSSISIERALKHAIACLENYSSSAQSQCQKADDEAQVAIDDLTLMLGAIQR